MKKYTLSERQHQTALRDGEVVITIKGKKVYVIQKQGCYYPQDCHMNDLDIEIVDNSQSDNYDDSNEWALGQI